MKEKIEFKNMEQNISAVGWWKDKRTLERIVAVIAIGGAIFHLYVANFGFRSEVGLRGIH